MDRRERIVRRLVAIVATTIVLRGVYGSNHHIRPLAFLPFPPPRFDVFSENLVCSWTSPEDVASPVEEVMRSCGGAVQGMREPTIGNSLQDDDDSGKTGVYLNRANDGFLFVDDGSYTFGSVAWEGSELFMGNFMVGKSRLRLSCSLSPKEENDDGTNIDATFLRKTFGGLDVKPSMVETTADPSSITPQFCEIIRCSMQSANQPWMSQRAKWERKKVDVTKEQSIDSEETEEESKLDERVICWCLSQSASEFSDWTNNASLLTTTGSEGSVVQMGIVCRDTSTVQVLARHYRSDGKLANVLFLSGIE